MSPSIYEIQDDVSKEDRYRTSTDSRIDLWWVSRSADHPLPRLCDQPQPARQRWAQTAPATRIQEGQTPHPPPRSRCLLSRVEKCYNASSCLGCGLFSGLWEPSRPRGWAQSGEVTHTEADRLGRRWRMKTGVGSSSPKGKSQEHLNPNTVMIIQT